MYFCDSRILWELENLHIKKVIPDKTSFFWNFSTFEVTFNEIGLLHNYFWTNQWMCFGFSNHSLIRTSPDWVKPINAALQPIMFDNIDIFWLTIDFWYLKSKNSFFAHDFWKKSTDILKIMYFYISRILSEVGNLRIRKFCRMRLHLSEIFRHLRLRWTRYRAFAQFFFGQINTCFWDFPIIHRLEQVPTG